MTLPREIVPGRFYMVTRRCLAEAAQRYDIDVLLPCAMALR